MLDFFKDVPEMMIVDQDTLPVNKAKVMKSIPSEMKGAFMLKINGQQLVDIIGISIDVDENNSGLLMFHDWDGEEIARHNLNIRLFGNEKRLTAIKRIVTQYVEAQFDNNVKALGFEYNF